MKKSLMLIAVAAAMVACGTSDKQKKVEQDVDTTVQVKATTAETQIIELSETYTAELKAYKENDITPAAQGLHIDRIMFDVGDEVREGDVLVVLEQTTLKQQELNLATLQANYNSMVPVANAGGISKLQLTELENTLNLQKEIVEQLRKNSTIVSPISGVVTARNFEEGDLFASMPILHIMQIDKLKVMTNVSEQFYPNVKVGQKVIIEVDIFPGEQFEGRVSRVNPSLDAATRTFGVEVTVPNSDKRLRPGMYARTTFIMGERESVMVEDVAIQKQSGSSERFVYVLKDGVAEYRFVKDGRRVGTKVEILDGLQAGEQVATTSFVRLMDGRKVEIIK